MSRETIIRFILNQRFNLKFEGVSRRLWRKRISAAFVILYPGNAEAFVGAWEELAGKGLI